MASTAPWIYKVWTKFISMRIVICTNCKISLLCQMFLAPIKNWSKRKTKRLFARSCKRTAMLARSMTSRPRTATSSRCLGWDHPRPPSNPKAHLQPSYSNMASRAWPTSSSWTIRFALPHTASPLLATTCGSATTEETSIHEDIRLWTQRSKTVSSLISASRSLGSLMCQHRLIMWERLVVDKRSPSLATHKAQLKCSLHSLITRNTTKTASTSLELLRQFQESTTLSIQLWKSSEESRAQLVTSFGKQLVSMKLLVQNMKRCVATYPRSAASFKPWLIMHRHM